MPDPLSQETNPWSQRKNEPHQRFIRFKKFARMGPGRKLLTLYNLDRVANSRKKGRKVPASWYEIVKKWEWVERAQAYDRYQDDKEQTEQDERRRNYKKRETAVADALLEKAEQMLKFPIAKTTTEQVTDGGAVVNRTTIMPTKWSFSDAARIVQTADGLMRLSLDMETDRQVTKHEISLPAELEKRAEQRWAAIADKLSLLEGLPSTKKRKRKQE